MPTYVAFLRAVNVGGRWVKMADLRETLSDNGFDEVETYIQSGNVRLGSRLRSSAKVEQLIEALMQDRFGLAVPTMVRTPAELMALSETVSALELPLPGEPRRYVTFLKQEPTADAAAALNAWEQPHERVRVIGRDAVMWLNVAAHEARLTNARLERLSGAVSTTRDIKVVEALAERWGARAR